LLSTLQEGLSRALFGTMVACFVGPNLSSVMSTKFHSKIVLMRIHQL